MTIRKPPVLKPQFRRDFRESELTPERHVRVPEAVLQSREDYMLYLGKLDPKALLDDIDNQGDSE